jgi:glucose/arabinose dehydrogenase
MKKLFSILNLFAFFSSFIIVHNTKAQGPIFEEQFVATGLSNPTAMAFAPDGRAFICLQGGVMRVVKNGSLLPTPAMSIAVNSSGERGLLGIAFDPSFTTNGYLYVYYTTPNTFSPLRNRVCRFTVVGDLIDISTEVLLMDLEALSATNHNGGGLAFGPDGKLYIAVGDNANASNAQLVTNRLGKILRINSDGTIPADNPTTIIGIGDPIGINKSIWCAGLRNPYTLAFQPGTGTLYVNEVGQNAWEEINDCTVGGKNYGWPATEGNFNQASFPNYTLPVHAYGHSGVSGQGFAITGGTFFNPPQTNYPASYIGSYFYMDFSVNWIWYLTPNILTNNKNKMAKSYAPLAPTEFKSPIAGNSVGLTTGPEGNLYYLSRATGSLVRIVNSTTLPVKLTAFFSKITTNQSVILKWETSSATNFSHFEVQKSVNSSAWKTLGEIKATQNYSELKSYQYVDMAPNEGINYYRLKMVDITGKFEYSKVISEKINFNNENIKIYPNPGSYDLVVEGSICAENCFKILDVMGKDLTYLVVYSNIERNKHILNIVQLPKGVYILKTANGSKSIIKN